MNKGLNPNVRAIDYDLELLPRNLTKLRREVELGYRRARKNHPELPEEPIGWAKRHALEAREGMKRKRAKEGGEEE